jgi:hypothetical protein
MTATGNIGEANPKSRTFGVRTFVLLATTIALHLFVLIGPDYMPLFKTEPGRFYGIILVLWIPTLWAVLLQIRYRKPPETIATNIAVLGAIFWWFCFIAHFFLRP